MATVNDILRELSSFAPTELAESYDNVGFIVGHRENEVKKITVALDITDAVIEEAVKSGSELIVSHHPVIFNERKRITDEDTCGAVLLKLCENRIAAICMHTNLDMAQGGVNDALCASLGIVPEAPVVPKEDGAGGGRYGNIAGETSLCDFIKTVCRALSASGVRFHDAGRTVKKVAVGGGSCGGYIKAAYELGCDTLVTADVKHDQFAEASHLGINVIDAGHFETENVVCPVLLKKINEAFPEIRAEISKDYNGHAKIISF